MNRKQYQHNWYLKNKEKVIKGATKWAKENPEKVALKTKKWQSKNKDRVLIAGKKWEQSHPQELKEKRYRFYYAKWYKTLGLNKEDVERLRIKHGDICFICKKNKAICLDHSHSTMKFRGFLCRNCNFALGLLEDNPQYFKNAIDYLKRPIII